MKSFRSKAEKKPADKTQLSRLYRAWRREHVEALLTGPYGEQARALLAYLRTMRQPSGLIAFVKSQHWNDADQNTRNEIFALIDTMIIRQREKLNLVPFDDPLPFSDAPANSFLFLRDYLAPDFPSADGAIRGEARFSQRNTVDMENRKWQMK